MFTYKIVGIPVSIIVPGHLLTRVWENDSLMDGRLGNLARQGWRVVAVLPSVSIQDPSDTVPLLLEKESYPNRNVVNLSVIY